MRLIDANACMAQMKNMSVEYDAETVQRCIEIVSNSPTIDAVPLDGSFLKMSRGDYLIYKRHWLYEHFDMEMDIQRSAMKSIGYEPALKDAEPHWIPCSERMPEENRTVIASTEYGVFPEARYTKEDGWEWAYESGADYWGKIAEVKAWMPLPKPYEVEE